jgi:hypothetical protein
MGDCRIASKPASKVASGHLEDVHVPLHYPYLLDLQLQHTAYRFPGTNRALTYSPDNQFTCLPFHSPRRLVCGRQDHQQGYMVGYGISVRGHWYVCGFEDVI